MDSTTNIEDLKQWLAATNLSTEEQKDFLNRFETEGKWTPQLAEEFAQIITNSLDATIKDLESYTDEMKKRSDELNDLEQQMDAEHKDYINQQYGEFQKEKKELEDSIDEAAAAYTEAKIGNTEDDMNDILSNP